MVKFEASKCTTVSVFARKETQNPDANKSNRATRFCGDTISAKHILFLDAKYYYQRAFDVIRITPNNLLKMILP
jgi:hypothetical protein